MQKWGKTCKHRAWYGSNRWLIAGNVALSCSGALAVAQRLHSIFNKIISEQYLGMVLQDVVKVEFNAPPTINLKGLRKSTKILSQHCWSLHQFPTRNPPNIKQECQSLGCDYTTVSCPYLMTFIICMTETETDTPRTPRASKEQVLQT